MKKTLAILLSLALVICMIPGTAFAGETVTYTATTLTESNTTISVNDVVYNGTAQTPAVTVIVNGTTLKTTDYNVAYTNNTNVGEATVTVTGVHVGSAETAPTENITADNAGYYGSVTKTFNITALDLNSAIITTTADIVSTDITDTALNDTGLAKLSVKVGETTVTTGESGMAILESVYNATNATVTVTVKDADEQNANVVNYRSATFPVKKSITREAGYVVELASNETFTYTGSALVPRYGVRVVKKDESGKIVETIPTNGYTVAYSKNITGGTDATVTVVGTGVYSGTLVNDKIFHINQKPITSSGITIEVATALANATPEVIVKDGNIVLIENTDYTVSKSGNVVTITGAGNYGGTTTKTFTIVDKSISTVEAASGVTYYYNGSAQAPLLTVKGSDDKTLTQNYDYKITYTDANGKAVTPVNAGTYTYTVVGMGKYAGTKTGTFTIAPFPKDWVDVTVSAGYTTSTPYVSVRSFDGKINFVQDKDFKVLSVYPNTYSNKVTVYISTMGNLESGSLTAEYALVAKSIASCNAYFTNGRSSSPYTGSVVSAPITVKDGYYTTLTQGTHYTVTYKNSLGKVVSSIRDAGTYTIEITGKGMYSGTTYLTYTVTGTDISYYTVTLKESSVQATGYSKVPTITSVKYGYTSSLTSSDYTVTYKNYLGETVTSMSTPGTYTVVVTGKNGYQGSTTATFKIVGLDQTVTVAEGTSKKVYEDSAAFKITPKATGDGTGFIYTTSDPTVATVSATGTITVKGVGRAKITVTTTGNKKYNPESASFFVKVYPDKVKQTKKPWTDGKKGQLKVRWGYQEGVTKYEIMYSTSSTFKNAKTKTVNAHGKDYTTQSTTIKELKNNTKYYVKVRAVYQTYNEEGTKITYRGAWSPWRSATTKK